MAKKKSKPKSNLGCVSAVLLLAILVFAGIYAGFYMLENSNLFSSSDLAIISVEQMNPSATQILETANAVTPDTVSNSPTFTRLLNDVNALRAEAGLNPLVLDSRLNRAAAEQAVYNASIYSATHQDANGNEADARISAQGYEWQTVGENLLGNWSLDGNRVFTLWEGSPSHYANMMNPDFTEIGLAYMVTPIGQVYHAMVLARPQ